jgi:GNAT superfamily N-acetyltransferase
VRLPVERPAAAVAFLRARSRGVMDLIAHFWERLAQTPPLQRPDLHLVAAVTGIDEHINMATVDPAAMCGAMLFVPKAHRADVLALDAAAAAAFAGYISHHAARAGAGPAAGGGTVPPGALAAFEGAEGGAGGGLAVEGPPVATLTLTDLSAAARNGAAADRTVVPAEPPARVHAANGKVPIDFVTGDAAGVFWMTPLLLPLVHKRAPARKLVNVVMQLPAEVAVAMDPNVRLAQDADIPVLNRWRRQYKEERGILFDADMDAWVQHQRVFVYEVEKQVVAVAKVDLELHDLVEIGGVYTFPEFRKRGYGAGIVRDLACRIRQMGKTPTLQVDEQNDPAVQLYASAGWQQMGKLARVWLTG